MRQVHNHSNGEQSLYLDGVVWVYPDGDVSVTAVESEDEAYRVGIETTLDLVDDPHYSDGSAYDRAVSDYLNDGTISLSERFEKAQEWRHYDGVRMFYTTVYCIFSEHELTLTPKKEEGDGS